MIKEFVDALVSAVFGPIGEFFSGWVEFFTSPLWLWGGIGMAVFVVFLVIAIFLPFKWVRATLGGLLVLGGAFLSGGIVMYRTMKGDLAEEKRKRKEAEKQVRQQRQQERPRSNWFNFN